MDDLKAFLDGLARLSARHGLVLAGEVGVVPKPEHFGGYAAALPEARLQTYDAKQPPQGADRIVSDDVSPAGVERRNRDWREANAEALESYSREVEARVTQRRQPTLRDLLLEWDKDADDPELRAALDEFATIMEEVVRSRRGDPPRLVEFGEEFVPITKTLRELVSDAPTDVPDPSSSAEGFAEEFLKLKGTVSPDVPLGFDDDVQDAPPEPQDASSDGPNSQGQPLADKDAAPGQEPAEGAEVDSHKPHGEDDDRGPK